MSDRMPPKPANAVTVTLTLNHVEVAEGDFSRDSFVGIASEQAAPVYGWIVGVEDVGNRSLRVTLDVTPAEAARIQCFSDENEPRIEMIDCSGRGGMYDFYAEPGSGPIAGLKVVRYTSNARNFMHAPEGLRSSSFEQVVHEPDAADADVLCFCGSGKPARECMHGAR